MNSCLEKIPRLLGRRETAQDPNVLRILDKIMNEFVFGEDSKTVGSKEDWI